ncbi:hypothetical protein [Sulfurospirillum arsenophilum]|uniref:hypothetical protein n=1 Tax=Sulfurospirillum arsenophilum TaxID=56698 RepID=UPI001E329E2E|nr:hypothetical protein [Sulfurospirillum arsenophilum]
MALRSFESPKALPASRGKVMMEQGASEVKRPMPNEATIAHAPNCEVISMSICSKFMRVFLQ